LRYLRRQAATLLTLTDLDQLIGVMRGTLPRTPPEREFVVGAFGHAYTDVRKN